MLPYGGMRPRRATEAFLLVLLSALGAVVFTYPLAFNLGHLGRVNTDDGRWSIWVVSWVARTLLVDPLHVFDANIFYPHRNALAYSENNLGAGLLAVPAYWLTKNPYVAHNVVVLLAFALSTAGMYLLARRLTGDRGAAAVAAITYGYCPYLFGRTPHIQLLITSGLPFTMLAFHAVVDRPTIGRGMLLAVALVATGLTCGYYGIFAGLMVGLATVVFGISRARWRDPRFGAAIGVAAVVTLAAMSLVYVPYRQVQAETGFVRGLAEATPYSADWRAYLASGSWAHRWMLPLLGHWNDILFPGFVSILFGIAGAAGGLRKGRSRDTILLYAAIGAIALWISFGPPAGLYSALYYSVPAFRFLRAPARFGVLVTFALSVLCAFGVAKLTQGRRRGAWMAAALALAAGIELAAMPIGWREVEPIAAPYRTLALLPRGPVLEMPFWYLRPDFPRHAYYMLNSTAHWQPLINGYSDYIPDDFRDMVIPISSFPTRESFAMLEKRGARYVVFHLNFYSRVARPRVLERIEEFSSCLRPLSKEGDVWLFEIVGWPR
jgi:hypothetical protein